MKLSRAIELLQRCYDHHGDCDVLAYGGNEEGMQGDLKRVYVKKAELGQDGFVWIDNDEWISHMDKSDVGKEFVILKIA